MATCDSAVFTVLTHFFARQMERTDGQKENKKSKNKRKRKKKREKERDLLPVGS